MLSYHQKVVSISNSYASLKQRHQQEVQKRRNAETDLAAAKLQLSELDDLRGKLKDLQLLMDEKDVEHGKELSKAHNVGFEEAKAKVIEHYRGQVAEIQSNGFRKGAEIYYFKGVAKGYELGLEAGSVPAESALRAVPEVEVPDIEIPSEEEENDEEEEAAEDAEEGVKDTAENVAEASNKELGKDLELFLFCVVRGSVEFYAEPLVF